MYEHKIFTDEEIRELVVKVFDVKVFTSFQCPNDIAMVFMPILFINSPPSPPAEPKPNDDIKQERKDKLNYLDDKKKYDEVILPNWEKNDQPKIKEFLSDVGMIYESMDKALPTQVNGLPIFGSCGFLSKADSQRFIDVYGKYEKIRTDLDKSF